MAEPGQERDGEREALTARVDAVEAATDEMRIGSTLESVLSLPLTVQQLKATAIVVASGGECTAQRLAAVLNVSLATVSGLVDRLVDHGVVGRVEDSRDRRVRKLVATGKGRQILEDLVADSMPLRHAVLREMALEDLRALVRGLEAFTRLAFRAAPDGGGAGDAGTNGGEPHGTG